MKQNRRIPIIIEFNGLPGLGKTTVAKKLIDRFNQLGYSAIPNYRYSVFHTLHHPFPELYDRRLYNLVLTYSKQIPPFNSKRTHVHWTNYYVQKYESIIRHCNADFVVIDEGIIQFFQSMAWLPQLQSRLPHSDIINTIVNRIIKKNMEFVRVDCINNVEIAAKRIMSRPPRGLAYETMDYDELKKTLSIESDNFEYLRSIFSKLGSQKSITIDTITLDPNTNASIIIEWLMNEVYNY